MPESEIQEREAGDIDLAVDPDAIVFNKTDHGALSRRLEHATLGLGLGLLPPHVSVLFSSAGVEVAMLLKVSNCKRWFMAVDGIQRTDVLDIIVQQIYSRTHRRGHATEAIKTLAEIAAQLDPPRGVQLQQTITPAGKALGRRLARDHGYASDTDGLNFYSPPK
jgi:hypothetical protein